MWVCENCKAENEDTFDICWNCNHDIDGNKIATPVAPYEEEKQKREAKANCNITKKVAQNQKEEAEEKAKPIHRLNEKYFWPVAKILGGLLGAVLILSLTAGLISDSQTAYGIAIWSATTILAFVHFSLLLYLIMIVIHTLLSFAKAVKGKGYFQRVKNRLSIRFFNVVPKSYYLITMILFASLSLFAYVDQRITWINSETRYHKAKEYFVAGEPLSLYRQLLSKGLYPDSVILQPLNYMQQKIYNTGIPYLSTEDAEASLWYLEWFTKPYSKRMYIPYNSFKRHNDPETKRSKLLAEIYPHLITLSTKEVKDPKMFQLYLRAYPNVMSYYTYYQMRSRTRLEAVASKVEYIKYAEENQVLFMAMEHYYKQREKSGVQFTDPMLIVPVYTAILEITSNLIIAQLETTHLFRCDEPYIAAYSDARNKLFGMKGEGLISLIDTHHRENIKFMWGSAGFSGTTPQFIVEQICSIPTSTYNLMWFGKESAYESDLKFYAKDFYRMMQYYKHKGERENVVEQLEKYIGVLKRSEGYRKQFEEIDKEFKNINKEEK